MEVLQHEISKGLIRCVFTSSQIWPGAGAMGPLLSFEDLIDADSISDCGYEAFFGVVVSFDAFRHCSCPKGRSTWYKAVAGLVQCFLVGARRPIRRPGEAIIENEGAIS